MLLQLLSDTHLHIARINCTMTSCTHVPCFIRVNENRKLLERRLNEIADSQNALESELKSDMERAQTLMSQMNQLKPEIRRLFKEQEETKV